MIFKAIVNFSIPGTINNDFVFPHQGKDGDITWIKSGIKDEVVIKSLLLILEKYRLTYRETKFAPCWGNPHQNWIETVLKVHDSWNWYLPHNWTTEETKFILNALESGKLLMLVTPIKLISRNKVEVET